MRPIRSLSRTTSLEKIVLHADLNSFFAKAEQQANPAIRNKPVGVVKGKGRSCIIAASPEAKMRGVYTGSRVYDARKSCPDIILVPADFSKYEDISRRFIKICATYTPLCEVFSLDECFLDVTETEKFWGNAFNIAFDIKRRLREEVGDYLTVSVGVSYNRLLAKLACGQIKVDGLFWITPDNALEVLDKTKLTGVCGLGWGLSNHLTKLGLESFAQIRACSREFLHKEFGSFWGPYLYDLSRGIDRNPVNSFRSIADQKSVGRTYTTHRPLNKRREIYNLTRNLAEEVAFKARRMNLAGRHVTYWLRTSPKKWSGPDEEDNISWYGHRTLKNHIDSGKTLFELCKLISKEWKTRDVIFCGVGLGMLVNSSNLTTPIFKEECRGNKLIKSADLINDKYGEYTLFPAQLLGMPIVMPEVTGYFGDKKYQIKRLEI